MINSIAAGALAGGFGDGCWSKMRTVVDGNSVALDKTPLVFKKPLDAVGVITADAGFGAMVVVASPTKFGGVQCSRGFH